jgi:competence protein ComEC
MTPLFIPVLALSVACGVALAWPVFPVAFGVAVVAGVGALVARRRPLPFLALLSVSAAASGAALSGAALSRPVPACDVSHIADGRTTRRLVLDVLEPAVQTQHDQVLLAAPRWQESPASGGLCGVVEVRLPRDVELVTGDRILLRGRVRPMMGSRNPGTDTSRLRLLSRRIGARVYADGSLVLLGPGEPSLVERARVELRGLLDRSIAPGRGRQIVRALVLGDRHSVGTEVRRSFARAGISHLLAVSGLHLTLLAGGVLLLLRRGLLRIPPLARRIDVRVAAVPVALAAALAYTLLTGAAPSTTRACIMTAACLLGLCSGRPPDLVRPLGLAALGLLVLDPLNLFRPGFQLSFMAVVGIGAAASRAPRSRLSALALTTLVATAATAPVVAYHFHIVSLAGLLTNLLAIPLTTFVLLPLALCGAVVGLVWPAAGAPLLAGAGWVASRIADGAAMVADSDILVLRWSPAPLVALAATGVTLAFLAPRRTWPRRALLAAALVLIGVSAARGLVRRVVTPRVEATFLDVGQGDSTFLELPGGATLLVDAGGSHGGRWDPGAARVVPFLAAQGVRRLDIVVASHPHPDHIGGLAAVLESVEVGELWVCWHETERCLLPPPAPPDCNPWLRAVLEQARRRGVPVRRPRVVKLGRATVRPLWPRGTGSACADPALDANDNSVVLRVEFGRGALLLAGDVEAPAEVDLVALGGLRSQVLKVPHHGSDSSSSLAFLKAVSPRVAVVSCGAGNSFGFPDEQVVERYRSLRIPLVRTDRLGAIRVELFEDGAVGWNRLTRF